MEVLKLLGIVWLALFFLGCLTLVIGIIIEKKFDESSAVKKWWRKHMIAPDPFDNDWKNFNG